MQAQERDLSAAGCDKLFIEQVSSVGKRQQLDAALDYVREGDTLIVTKLDRLARSVPDLLTMVARLEGKNVVVLGVATNPAWRGPLPSDLRSTARTFSSAISRSSSAECGCCCWIIPECRAIAAMC